MQHFVSTFPESAWTSKVFPTPLIPTNETQISLTSTNALVLFARLVVSCSTTSVAAGITAHCASTIPVASLSPRVSGASIDSAGVSRGSESSKALKSTGVSSASRDF